MNLEDMRSYFDLVLQKISSHSLPDYSIPKMLILGPMEVFLWLHNFLQNQDDHHSKKHLFHKNQKDRIQGIQDQELSHRQSKQKLNLALEFSQLNFSLLRVEHFKKTRTYLLVDFPSWINPIQPSISRNLMDI